MLLVCFKSIDVATFVDKYKDKSTFLSVPDNKTNNNWLVEYIENIKESLTQYDIVFIYYSREIILSLNTLQIEYKLVYPNKLTEQFKQWTNVYNIFLELAKEKESILLNKEDTLETVLSGIFDWINLKEVTENKQEIPVVQENKPVIPENKNHLTLQQLLDEDVDITEADVRELKATTNKLKVAMLLQAKSRLNTVLKLSNTLDKLYDELVNRIDTSIQSTDTASLMYTTEYIAKALNETNQFITSLINNEKIQNFFIIDNSSVINVGNERVDINSREKLRKAAEIVMNNIDYFTNGQYENIQNPNVIDISEEQVNGDSTT